MAKMFQTYFGIPVPPWKENKLPAGAVSIRFVLVGKVPSKKNNMMSVAVRKEAMAYVKKLTSTKPTITRSEALKAIKMVYSKVRPNNEYLSFVEKQKPILQAQMAEHSASLRDKGLIFPLTSASVNLRFYFESRYIQDTVNKQQSIQDLLIAAGVIANDDYETLNPINSSSACFHEEILETITNIYLTFKL